MTTGGEMQGAYGTCYLMDNLEYGGVLWPFHHGGVLNIVTQWLSIIGIFVSD